MSRKPTVTFEIDVPSIITLEKPIGGISGAYEMPMREGAQAMVYVHLVDGSFETLTTFVVKPQYNTARRLVLEVK